MFHDTGLRVTQGRVRILEILSLGEPLTAREIWEKMLVDKKRSGFATVYRTLSVLCTVGLARKRLSEHGMLYEGMNSDALPQLVCSRCGKVEEVDDPGLLRYNTGVIKDRSLTDGNALLLYADCRRKGCAENK